MVSPAASLWFKTGAVSGASAVLLGAFGAHGLQNRVKDPKMLKNWDTAAQYHLLHSAVLLAVPFARRPNLVGGLITTGIVFFSGSLYTLVLTEKKRLGMITPMGGLMFVAGWLCLLL
ncbi:hypothetical protein THRCLA_20564 [Thraustotheca clavata]|uniref:Transmembrane protein n=1 Tax=Thraustotheca clavata TaxID=74557 RepID=A0A1W0A5T2_9STRA|nr:hypothetical protein THRCLA_20564 [Thraustotheca clavata]